MYEGYIGNGPERPQVKIINPIVIIEPVKELLHIFKGLGGTLIIDDEPRESYEEAVMAHTIELDCPPGDPRPDDLLPKVLEGTPLTPDDFEVISKSFGNWTFQLKDDEKSEIYTDNRETYKERITNLYNQGKVRYASW